jgi:hypothetical protein
VEVVEEAGHAKRANWKGFTEENEGNEVDGLNPFQNSEVTPSFVPFVSFCKKQRCIGLRIGFTDGNEADGFDPFRIPEPSASFILFCAKQKA